MWTLGRHRLLCGDAREAVDIATLLGRETVDLLFTTRPIMWRSTAMSAAWVRSDTGEFAMAAGEMSGDEFRRFLEVTLGHAAAAMRDGALAFVCMDWRHVADLIGVGERLFDAFKNVIVWNKTNGGMGSFYRSKHELICVFKKGTAPHTNSFGLGDGGAIAPMSGTIRGSARSAGIVSVTSPCTRPSSRWRWLRMRCAIVRSGLTSCSTASEVQARP